MYSSGARGAFSEGSCPVTKSSSDTPTSFLLYSIQPQLAYSYPPTLLVLYSTCLLRYHTACRRGLQQRQPRATGADSVAAAAAEGLVRSGGSTLPRTLVGLVRGAARSVREAHSRRDYYIHSKRLCGSTSGGGPRRVLAHSVQSCNILCYARSVTQHFTCRQSQR